jgi:hypothetical protein
VKLSTREESQTDLPGGEPVRQVALSPHTTTGHSGTEHALSPRSRGMAGGNAAVQRLATAPRPHAASLGLLSAGGGRALQRLSARTAQPKLTVSQPGDRFEVQADAVAARVGLGEAPAAPAPAVSLLAAPAAAAAAGGDEGPPGLAALLTDPGPGSAIPADVRSQIEPHLGFDLGSVQVHTSDRAQAAAAQLQARAFTSGGHIFLGAGQSPSDLALMAHEATHVVQQQAVGVYRSPVQRESDSWLPDFVIDEVKDVAHDVPGYTMLTVVAGYDPIANENVDRSPPNLVRGVLGLVPFGNEIAKRLLDMGILQEAFRMLDEGLTAHNLTLVRIQREIDQVWDELSVSNGISGNIEVVERHVTGLYRDAMAFIRGIIDAVLQLIRDAAVGLASKLLEGRPVWDLTKKVLHQDPLTGARVDEPTVEILADFLTLIGKQDTLAQMQERGTLQKTADWLDQQLGRFGSLVGELTALFEAAWNAIQPANIAGLPDSLSKLADDAVALVQRVGAFAADIMVTVLKLVKESLLGWLSTKAHDMRGFRLLTVIIGTDPFTGEDVPRTAENLIGGFVALLPGGEETYRKLAEAGVIAEAGAQIEAAVSTLGISPGMIVETFLGVWNSLSLQDLLNPIGAFLRVLEKFGEPLMRIISFVGEVIKVVIVLILKLMNFPSELLGTIISNAVAAIEDIKRDPVGFIINMLQALKSGLFAFLDKVLSYLLSGLADWLFRGLGAMGIQKPPDLTFASILTLVLQVLDITAEKLWSKLGKKIGDDVVAKIRAGVAMASDAFDFVKDVQENGVGAIWKHVESQLGNLWDTLLGMAQDWIVTEIVEKATAKLLSMLDPTGIMAVVNSTIAFFKAVQSVIDYIREILQIVNDYVSTLAAIAAGNIAAGAQKVEKGLADAVPVAIGFLANQAGLGNVPEKLVELIGKLRELVDKALDWLFDKAMQLGKAALNALGVGGEQADTGGPDTPESLAVKAKAATMLQEKIKTPFKTRAELDTTAAGVLDALRPEGLKAVIVTEKTDAPGHFAIAVAASAAKPAGEAVVGDDVAAVQPYLDKRVLVRSNIDRNEYLARVTGVEAAAGSSTTMLVVCTFDRTVKTSHTNPHSEPRRLILVPAFLEDMASATPKLVKPFTGGEHKSRFAQIDGESATGFSLGPDYRRGWRQLFYTSKYSDAVTQFKIQTVMQNTHPEDLAKPYYSRRWKWQEDGKYYLNEPDGDGEATVDHKPSVIKHFLTVGLHTTQAAREEWYMNGGDSQPPRIMPRVKNSELGSEGERLKDKAHMGLGFRGRDDAD